ncbi:hypothetical protein RJ641_018827 [Dillenia turbinata]|uniref:Conserved oligomeric Golgi complex subunit 1 n=1 Tax=Dillenia turbinata TaxID=194707 RepID=A0AAN8UQA0_9MAGN
MTAVRVSGIEDRVRDAESLFRSKPISELRGIEINTRKQIEEKQQELRQLVGDRYRDLIDSADSIVLMKSSCESISSNISQIETLISSLSAISAAETPKFNSNASKFRVYGIACRVKYLVDTPENIWGCLDESMFLEASGRYIRAKVVHNRLVNSDGDRELLSKFPLLQHQWQIVDSFRVQISQRSRERLSDCELGIGAYADALSAVAVIDELDPKQVLGLFLESRKSWVSQKLGTFSATTNDSDSVISVLCDVLKVIQVSLGQVGELFLQVLNDLPLFYKVALGSPPGTQLFGRIPNPDEEVKLWKVIREKLESLIVVLEKEFIAEGCLSWLRECGKEIISKINGRYIVDFIETGQGLGLAEKMIRDTIDSRDVLEGSLDWLRSVFGSEIESPWSRVCELVLGNDEDIWDGIFEEAFIRRMKAIIDSRFGSLNRDVNVRNIVKAAVSTSGDQNDFQAFLGRSSTGGGVWFLDLNSTKTNHGSAAKAMSDENVFGNCLSTYLGPEVSLIRDAVDSQCHNVVEDLLCFLESPKAVSRLKELAPYLQNKCYETLSTILTEIRKEIEHLVTILGNAKKEAESVAPAVIVERSLVIGRLLFAFQNHSRHIPVVLGSPRSWTRDKRIPIADSSRRHTSIVTASLFAVNDSVSPRLGEVNKVMRDLCIQAHDLWILWVSNQLSNMLSANLRKDEALSATTTLRVLATLLNLKDHLLPHRIIIVRKSSKAVPLQYLVKLDPSVDLWQGWEETVIKQDDSSESPSEMKIFLPSTPSLYITSFLFRACEEIHQVGGHVLDILILQKFASILLDRVIDIYSDFLSNKDSHGSQLSEKGTLQVLLDFRFIADILCGVDIHMNEEFLRSPKTKLSFRRKQDQNQTRSVIRKRINGLVNRLSQRLDPIDWLTCEPYLWENEKQSYLRHAVLFGFFVQLNRMYTDTMQKLPTNSESNILRCSTVPRFKYLPISAPALSSRAQSKTSHSKSSEDFSSGSWKAYNSELSSSVGMDDTSSFGVATPLLKSFMQVGSRFGDTLKLGSMLSEGQVGRFKDKSALSTFGDMLPVQAAGLLSSFTAARSDS